MGGDPKILPVKFSEVDASKEIDPAPRGGSTQLRLRKIGYEELRTAGCGVAGIKARRC